MAYDSPEYAVRRDQSHLTVAGATTESARIMSFQRLRLKKVHAQVVTAGTAPAHALNIYHGTTSIGAISIGTATAHSQFSSALLDRTVESLERLAVRTGADATGVCLVSYEYEILPDAVKTA